MGSSCLRYKLRHPTCLDVLTQYAERSTREVMEIYLNFARFFVLAVVECVKDRIQETEHRIQETGDHVIYDL